MQKRLRLNNKQGAILVENVMFIILNMIFISILMLFIFSKTGGAAVLEEKYAKEIALIIDAAKSGMIIHINVEDALKEAEKNNMGSNKIIFLDGNEVTVKLREKGSYSYGFFNDADVSIFPDDSSNPIKEYVIVVN
ncbi:MAG: hypothetical protein ABIH49_01460 [archaeon]